MLDGPFFLGPWAQYGWRRDAGSCDAPSPSSISQSRMRCSRSNQSHSNHGVDSRLGTAAAHRCCLRGLAWLLGHRLPDWAAHDESFPLLALRTRIPSHTAELTTRFTSPTETQTLTCQIVARRTLSRMLDETWARLTNRLSAKQPLPVERNTLARAGRRAEPRTDEQRNAPKAKDRHRHALECICCTLPHTARSKCACPHLVG